MLPRCEDPYCTCLHSAGYTSLLVRGGGRGHRGAGVRGRAVTEVGIPTIFRWSVFL